MSQTSASVHSFLENIPSPRIVLVQKHNFSRSLCGCGNAPLEFRNDRSCKIPAPKGMWLLGHNTLPLPFISELAEQACRAIVSVCCQLDHP